MLDICVSFAFVWLSEFITNQSSSVAFLMQLFGIPSTFSNSLNQHSQMDYNKVPLKVFPFVGHIYALAS